jgi:epoxyqueuosine reductase
MKEKLKKMTRILQEKYGYFNYIITVDSSAISEKAWAVQTGIGYYGKNGIIQTSLGSFVFLGTVLIDIEVDKYDEPIKNSCNNCVKCMIACPTQAIVAPFCVDSNRCISNINLNKNESDFKNIAKYGWLVGCDICQNVCPNNAHAPVNKETIALRAPFMKNQNQILETLTPESFEHYFKNTTIYKFKYEGLMRRVEAMNSFVL